MNYSKLVQMRESHQNLFDDNSDNIYRQSLLRSATAQTRHVRAKKVQYEADVLFAMLVVDIECINQVWQMLRLAITLKDLHYFFL